ncbi:hypothetical protein BDW74DRAFT_172347 [Aspergillus multicolor]|uniref:uncharacterized protein n=1 Tax=Aspergillus multicolor TaxID=41759 RepID=UPI003CCD2250
MNVGMVVGIGTVSEDAQLQTVMERIGYDAINEEELFAQIEAAMDSPEKGMLAAVDTHGRDAHQIITGVNLLRPTYFWANQPRFRNLYANHDFSGTNDGKNKKQKVMAKLLEAKDEAERVDILTARFLEKIAAVLSVEQSVLQPSRSLGDYGLDSIVAIEIRQWLFETLGVELAMFDILSSRSIKALIERVASVMVLKRRVEPAAVKHSKNELLQLASGAADGKVSLPSVGSMPLKIGPDVPMSSFQWRLWFMHNLAEDPSFLNLRTIFRLQGRPKAELVEKTLRELNSRNEILRTAYFEGEEFSQQEVMEGNSAGLLEVDLSTSSDPEAALDDYIQELQSQPMDLELGEVMHDALVKLHDDRHALALIFHHICIDRGSSRSFLQQFTDLYNALRTERNLASINGPPVSYAEFSLWHNTLLGSPKMITSLEFWKYTEEENLTIHLVDGNRPNPAVNDTLWFFVNVVPVRCLVKNDTISASFKSVLRHVNNAVMSALAHSQVPFDAIVNAINAAKTPAHVPLGQVIMNYQTHGTIPVYSAGDFDITEVLVEDILTACEIGLEALEDPTIGLKLRLEYSTTLYWEPEMERFLENFVECLGSKYLRRNMFNLDFVSNIWEDQPVAERILAIARRYPDEVAVDSSDLDDARLTYTALVAQASDVLKAIQAFGVQPKNMLEETACALFAGLVLAVEQISGEGATIAAPAPVTKAGPFYTIYTSGSPGTPKGVVLSQSNTQQMLSTLHYDYNASIRKGPVALAKYMEASQVTVTYFTPTQFALLLEIRRRTSAISATTITHFNGERLPVRVAKAFYDLGTPARVYNNWSPCALVVQTTIEKVEYSSDNMVNIPIGYPLANVRHYILDHNPKPSPSGVVGETVVGGAQVGLGYINRADINEQAFLPDPFWDRGWYLPSGNIEFYGRIAGDKQVKLRGFRIDLGEVEHWIFVETNKDSERGVVDLAVIVRQVTLDEQEQESLTDNRQLIASVVPRQLPGVDKQAEFAFRLNELVGKHLNAYMLPNTYQFMDMLPTTIGGKADLQQLLNCPLILTYSVNTQLSSKDENEASSNEPILEAIIHECRQLLKLPKTRPIGPDDSFFALGGQSLLIVSLQARLKRALKMPLSLNAMFKIPTPRAIAQLMMGTAPTISGHKQSTSTINWNAEVKLDDSLQPAEANITPSQITSILLTGADSFIGVHMLATLQDNSFGTIYVLGSTKQLALAGVIEDMDHYQLPYHHLDLSTRLHFLLGSLISPGQHFGLSLSESALSVNLSRQFTT